MNCKPYPRADSSGEVASLTPDERAFLALWEKCDDGSRRVIYRLAMRLRNRRDSRRRARAPA